MVVVLSRLLLVLLTSLRPWPVAPLKPWSRGFRGRRGGEPAKPKSRQLPEREMSSSSSTYLSSIATPPPPKLRTLYPATAFTAEGYLERGGGGGGGGVSGSGGEGGSGAEEPVHRIYWREYGQPAGAPAALFLHGGPGAGCFPNHARFFDPSYFRIVLLDQRGCGRSTPRGELRGNDTCVDGGRKEGGEEGGRIDGWKEGRKEGRIEG